MNKEALTEEMRNEYWILLARDAHRPVRSLDPDDPDIWGKNKPVFLAAGSEGLELVYLLVFSSEEKAREYVATMDPKDNYPDIRIHEPLRMTPQQICEHIFEGDWCGCVVIDRDPEEGENFMTYDVGYLMDDFSDWDEG